MKYKLNKLVSNITGFDIFGIPVSVSYAGSDTYNTYLSSFCSVIIFVLIIINLTLLSLDYSAGKQNEQTTYEQFDRFDSDAYNLAENDVEIAAFTRDAAQIDAKLVSFTLYQKHPCDYEADECPDDEYLGTLDACSEARKDEIRAFQSKKVSKDQAQATAENAVCINSSDIYVKGEPNSRSEASITIMHEINPALYQESAPKCIEAVKIAFELCDKRDQGDLESIKILREQRLLFFCTKSALKREIVGEHNFSLRRYAEIEEYAQYFPEVCTPSEEMKYAAELNKQFHRKKDAGITVQLTFNQLDIKSGKFERLHKNIEFSWINKLIELGPREFVNNDDPIGVFRFEKEEINYLGLEGNVQISESILENFGATINGQLKLQLADIRRSNEREVYSLIVLIQDFGGFNDGVTLIPAIIMTFYNSKMFNAAKASVFPIKRKKQRPKSRNQLQ